MTYKTASQTWPGWRNNELPEDDPRMANVEQLANDLATVLRPLIRPQFEQDIVELLRAPILDAAVFGWRLFGLRDIFSFGWTDGATSPRLVHITPEGWCVEVVKSSQLDI